MFSFSDWQKQQTAHDCSWKRFFNCFDNSSVTSQWRSEQCSSQSCTRSALSHWQRGRWGKFGSMKKKTLQPRPRRHGGCGRRVILTLKVRSAQRRNKHGPKSERERGIQGVTRGEWGPYLQRHRKHHGLTRSKSLQSRRFEHVTSDSDLLSKNICTRSQSFALISDWFTDF